MTASINCKVDGLVKRRCLVIKLQLCRELPITTDVVYKLQYTALLNVIKVSVWLAG